MSEPVLDARSRDDRLGVQEIDVGVHRFRACLPDQVQPLHIGKVLVDTFYEPSVNGVILLLVEKGVRLVVIARECKHQVQGDVELL